MGQKINIDLSGVETFQRASEGVHTCKIASAEVKQSQGGNDMIVVAFEVTKGADKGARVYENYPLIDTALWKLKGLLQALGMKADGKVRLDLDKLTGRVLTVTVIHEEYDGKLRARVESVAKLMAATDDADEFDEEDEDEFEDEEVEEEEEVEEKKPAKKAAAKKTTKKAAPKKKADPEPEEDDDDDWDEDEEEEEKPVAKKATKKATSKKTTKKPAKKEEPEEDEDDDWDDDDDDWDEE